MRVSLAQTQRADKTSIFRVKEIYVGAYRKGRKLKSLYAIQGRGFIDSQHLGTQSRSRHLKIGFSATQFHLERAQSMAGMPTRTLCARPWDVPAGFEAYGTLAIYNDHRCAHLVGLV